MRRRALCVGLVLALLCSCAAPVAETGVEPPAAELPTGAEWADYYAQVILHSQPDGEAYTALSAEDGRFYLSLYGISPPEGEDESFGYAVYTVSGVDAREVAVVCGSDTGAAGMESYRQGRVGSFTGYAPDQAALVERGSVLQGDGMHVLLLCTDPAAAWEALEKAASPIVLRPYDPAEEPPEPYDWTKYVNEKGWKLFDPPGEFDMTPYDTAPILAAWETGDVSGLSEKDAAILAKCREIFRVCISGEMTDFERELALHHWLVENCAYDQTVHDPTTPMGREDNANPYGMLVKGYGICLGYASTFQLFMDLAGVECITVAGASAASSSDHAWNMVKLEGEWYCVDPTWDDTTIPHPEAYTPEELSRRHHRYFNVTSQHLRESDHQWDYEKVPETAATRFRWDGTGELPR